MKSDLMNLEHELLYELPYLIPFLLRWLFLLVWLTTLANHIKDFETPWI